MPLPANIDSIIPLEMVVYNQWVLWKYEEVDGRMTKVPYQTNGKKAASTRPETWTTLCDVLQVADNFDGIGFVFTEDSGIVGLDFDHVKKGAIWDLEALYEIRSLNSYSELSPSGEGAHVYVFAKSPGNIRKKGNREMYSSGRYFTVTGDKIPNTPDSINENQEAVNTLYKKWFTEDNKENTRIKHPESDNPDEDIISFCKKSKNAQKFEKLYAGNVEGYPSQSEADLALCSIIAFYTQDKEQIQRIFSGSGLYRPEKWGRRQDYVETTIKKALSGLTDVYTGEKKKDRSVRQKIEVPFDVVGNRIMQKFHIMTLDDTKEIYLYENGVYKAEGVETKINKEIREEYTRVYIDEWNEKIGTDLPEHLPVGNGVYVNEVMNYIKIYTAKNRVDIDQGQENLINLKNGIFNFETFELEPHDPKKYMIRQIPVSYNLEAKCPQISKFLSSVVHEEDIKVLIEFAGYALLPTTRMQKALMLYGNGGNGKSIFLRFLIAFVGEANTSNESLQRLETDKFAVSNLYGKLLNVFPDLSDQALGHNDTFKALVGGDRMRAEKKYKDAFKFYNTARLVFSANKIPPAKDDTRAYYRRWILVEFPNVFEGSNEDKDLIRKLTTEEELSGFLNLAIEGVFEAVYINEKFSYSRSIDDVERLYKKNSSPVEAFAEQCLIPSDSNIEKMTVYNAFKIWAKDNNVKEIRYNIFCRTMKALGYTDARPWGDKHESRENVWEGIGIDMGQVKKTQPVPKNR